MLMVTCVVAEGKVGSAGSATKAKKDRSAVLKSTDVIDQLEGDE